MLAMWVKLWVKTAERERFLQAIEEVRSIPNEMKRAAFAGP